MKNYFSYDAVTGEFQTHDTPEQARERADDVLEATREDAADSGWDENVTSICWGRLMGAVVQTGSEPAPAGSEFHQIVHFGLQTIPDPGAFALGAVAGETSERVAIAKEAFHAFEAIRMHHEDRANDADEEDRDEDSEFEVGACRGAWQCINAFKAIIRKRQRLTVSPTE